MHGHTVLHRRISLLLNNYHFQIFTFFSWILVSDCVSLLIVLLKVVLYKLTFRCQIMCSIKTCGKYLYIRHVQKKFDWIIFQKERCTTHMSASIFIHIIKDTRSVLPLHWTPNNFTLGRILYPAVQWVNNVFIVKVCYPLPFIDILYCWKCLFRW